jgi:hypothetical protein
VYDISKIQSKDQIHKFLDLPQQIYINYFFSPFIHNDFADYYHQALETVFSQEEHGFSSR